MQYIFSILSSVNTWSKEQNKVVNYETERLENIFKKFDTLSH